MSEVRLNTIEEAIADITAGKLVIVVDDEDRENEGDFLTAAENVTPEIINFMVTHGRGLVCTPLIEDRCKELELDLMVQNNTESLQTAFTVTVDLIGSGCTTGISAHDRAKTVQALVDPETKPANLARPGHINPLKAARGGVLRRAGHTEAAIDLARLSGFKPAGCIVEILSEDGTTAKLPELREIADKHDLKLVTIKDLIAYRLKNESLIIKEEEVDMPTQYGHFTLHAYTQTTTGEVHLALTKGKWNNGDAVLARVHSSCVTGDILHSLRCDCGEQLAGAMQMIEKEGKGVILYMNQEGRGIGLINKLKAYKLQEQGYDTVEANEKLGFPKDQRDYGIGAQILRDLSATKLKIITNNPRKRIGLSGYGLEIVENVHLQITPNPHNKFYLETKQNKLGHEFK